MIRTSDNRLEDEPEPGYDEWFRAGVEEALADTSEDIPHEEAMKHFHDAIEKARKLID